MTDFETVSVELPSGRSLEGQRETRHSVWLEGWELAEIGDVVRIGDAPWRVDDVQRARIGGQRATRLHVVRASPEESTSRSPTARAGSVDVAGPVGAPEAEPSRPVEQPATGRELDRRLGAALGEAGEAGPRYASELGALLRLTSHMERLGYRLSYSRVGQGPIVARVEPADGSRPPLEATGATVADALCRASLAALERWEDEAGEEDVRPPPGRPSRRPSREGSVPEPSDPEEALERG